MPGLLLSCGTYLLKLHLECKHLERTDLITRATLTIGKITGDPERHLGSGRHLLESLAEALDDSRKGEGCRLAAIIRGVKDGTIELGPLVVDDYSILSSRLDAISELVNTVLQTAG